MRKLVICLFIMSWILLFCKEGVAMTKTQKFFTDLSKDTIHLVDEYYAEGIEFHDPMVSINGREALKDYYAGVYEGPQEVSFEYKSEIQNGNELVLIWRMKFVNEDFNGGDPVFVDGSSHIILDENGQAEYHRDYFDMGQMVYKHVPILKHMVNFVDKKLAKKHAKSK